MSRGNKKKGTGSTPSGRSPRVRVKTARGRKASSTRWLDRQLNDPFVREAKRLGLRSRAAFKLIQLDEKYGIFGVGQKVVDLGACPGGWTQVAIERTRARGGEGRVVAIDVVEMEAVSGAQAIVADIRDEDLALRVRGVIGGPADVVLSDMAAPTTGHRTTDHLRTAALGEAALAFACDVLARDGSLVMKVFEGGGHLELMHDVKQVFTRVRTVKPAASRPASPEAYLVAMGYRGNTSPD